MAASVPPARAGSSSRCGPAASGMTFLLMLPVRIHTAASSHDDLYRLPLMLMFRSCRLPPPVPRFTQPLSRGVVAPCQGFPLHRIVCTRNPCLCRRLVPSPCLWRRRSCRPSFPILAAFCFCAPGHAALVDAFCISNRRFSWQDGRLDHGQLLEGRFPGVALFFPPSDRSTGV